ncbi:MAG: hypothetical protein SOS98_01535 [Varibaculum sp.]|nr:hypothetical protein [Varibaculum sp.]
MAERGAPWTEPPVPTDNYAIVTSSAGSVNVGNNAGTGRDLLTGVNNGTRLHVATTVTNTQGELRIQIDSPAAGGVTASSVTEESQYVPPEPQPAPTTQTPTTTTTTPSATTTAETTSAPDTKTPRELLKRKLQMPILTAKSESLLV